MTGLVLRSEKGAPLNSSELDGNFTYLKSLMDSFEVPAGVGITSITVSGRDMTVHLSDGSTRGPFLLPVAAPQWRDTYPVGFPLAVLDTFSIPDDGVYMVIVAHTAEDPFDPGLQIDGGPAYQKLWGFEITPASPLEVRAQGDDVTLAGDMLGTYNRLTAPGAADIIIPYDEVDDLAIGFTVTFRWVGTGPFTVRFMDPPTFFGDSTDTPVGILNVPDGLTADLRALGSTIVLTKGAANEWDLSGDLAPE